MKKILATTPALIIIAALIMTVAQLRSVDLIVGSKFFTEQKILGQMIAQLLEAHTDLTVRRVRLQGTKVCFSAITEADIDIYPEYTGTGLVNVLMQKYDPDMNRQDILKYVRREFEKRWNLLWLEPLGFSNTYAFAMRKKQARKLGIKKISDLKKYVDQLTFGFDHEYTTRPEFKRFEDVYGFGFQGNIVYLDPDITYKALQDGQVDVIDAFSTDGRISAYNLKILQDDKHLFPPYDACVLIRKELLNKHKNLKKILHKLSGKISAEKMRQMNYAVTDTFKSPADVAGEFLKKNGLL